MKLQHGSQQYHSPSLCIGFGIVSTRKNWLSVSSAANGGSEQKSQIGFSGDVPGILISIMTSFRCASFRYVPEYRFHVRAFTRQQIVKACIGAAGTFNDAGGMRRAIIEPIEKVRRFRPSE